MRQTHEAAHMERTEQIQRIQGVSNESKFVERLIPENGKGLFGIGDRQNDNRALALP